MSSPEVLISECAGFCWGVKRALELTLEAAKNAPAPVNTLGPLIHNPGVIEELKKQGVGVIDTPGQADAGGTVILRSHGVPQEVRDTLLASGVTVVDATCPFVAAAQEKAASLRRQGYFVIILGEREHPEVAGLRSYAGSQSLVVECASDLPATLPSKRIGVVVQTTQSPDGLSQLVATLAGKTRELLVYNTICNATEQRQEAAMALASQVDMVVVVGGKESANTRRLVELCAARQPRTYHVERPVELQRSWLDGVRKVGITAGASTPPQQIQAVAEFLKELVL